MNLAAEGNLSVRWQDALLITPSAIQAHRLVAEDLVLLGLDGSVREGRRQPSSEWRIHCDLLSARPEAGAVVHAHPINATALACLRRDIPAFHYMVAVAGGREIRCSGYATYGSAELSRQTLTAMEGRKACLLANHGLVALGGDLAQAVELALQVERLAEQYAQALQIGDPHILDDRQMEQVLAKFESYRAIQDSE